MFTLFQCQVMEVAVEINIGCCRLADNFWPGHLNMETFFTAIKCQADI